jgi:hypothetical protein
MKIVGRRGMTMVTTIRYGASKLPTHRVEKTMQVLLRFADPLADGSAEVDVVEVIAREGSRATTDFSRHGHI